MQSVKIINDLIIEREYTFWFYVNNPISYESFKGNKVLRNKIKDLYTDNVYMEVFKRMMSWELNENEIEVSCCIQKIWPNYVTSRMELVEWIVNSIGFNSKETLVANKKKYIEMIYSFIQLIDNWIDQDGNNFPLERLLNKQNFYNSDIEKIMNHIMWFILIGNRWNYKWWSNSDWKYHLFKNIAYLTKRQIEPEQELYNSVKWISKYFSHQYRTIANYKKEYLLYLLLSSTTDLFIVVNMISNDCNLVDSSNLYKFIQTWYTTIIPLKYRNRFIKHSFSEDKLVKYNTLRKSYAKTDDSGIILNLEQYLADLQVISFECEKKESHYILKPTYLKYQWEQIPNQIIKDTEGYGHKQEVNHREEKRIYYTPTYKKPKVVKTEWKNIDSN